MWVQQNSRINSKQRETGCPQKLEKNLGTWAGPNRPYHKLNLELELRLKNQSATELAQQNKELLTAEWAAQVSDRKHSRVTMRVHPLVAESVTRIGELVLDRTRKMSVAVNIVKSRSLVIGAHVAAEVKAAAFQLALANRMSGFAISAVDGRGDGLHDLLALEEVLVLLVVRVQLVVLSKTGGCELVGELALVGVRALLRA